MSLFQGLGVLIILYTLYSLSRGEVLAKSGIRWVTVSRVESPVYFWTVIVIYGGVSIMLFFIPV